MVLHSRSSEDLSTMLVCVTSSLHGGDRIETIRDMSLGSAGLVHV